MPPAHRLVVETRCETAQWDRIPALQQRLIKAAALVWKNLPAKFHFPCSVSLLLTTDKSIRILNRDFRGIDKPTNVLSFPQFEPHQLSKMGKRGCQAEIGDIVIAYQYIVAEAKKDHKILINHVTHLFIHGLLHLFGYDHLSDTEAGKMERLEKRIMAELGLPDPYRPVPASKAKSRPKTKRARQLRTRK